MNKSSQPPTEQDLELLSAYLDGELTGRDLHSLELRLAADNALRDQLESLRETVALVRTLPTLRAPRNFTLDPDQFGQPEIAWWRRLTTSPMTWQVAGALGTAASLLLIVASLVTSGLTTNSEYSVSEQMAAPQTDEAIAMLSTEVVSERDQSLPTHVASTQVANESQVIATLQGTRERLFPAPSYTPPATPTQPSAPSVGQGQATLPTPTLVELDGMIMGNTTTQPSLDAAPPAASMQDSGQREGDLGMFAEGAGQADLGADVQSGNAPPEAPAPMAEANGIGREETAEQSASPASQDESSPSPGDRGAESEEPWEAAEKSVDEETFGGESLDDTQIADEPFPAEESPETKTSADVDSVEGERPAPRLTQRREQKSDRLLPAKTTLLGVIVLALSVLLWFSGWRRRRS